MSEQVGRIQTSLDTGIIYIKSQPPGAEVYLNGDFYGPTPLRLEDVEPGIHEYKLRAVGYDELAGQIYVESGKVSPEFAVLSPSGQISYGQTSYKSLGNFAIGPMGPSIGPHIQSLQAPPATPGYIIVPERTVIWVLGGMVIALLLYAVLNKK